MILHRNGVTVSRGFVLLLAFLLWLDEGLVLLIPGLLACLLHELGHLTAMKAVGVHVKQIHLTAIGAEMVVGDRRVLSYGREALVALSGPLSSMAFAFLSAKLGFYLFAGMCLGQGIFNLLPVLPLDGGKTLHCVLSLLFEPERADSVLRVFSAVTVGLLFGVGLLVLKWFGNLTLVLTVIWLMIGLLNKGRTGEKYQIKRK